MGGRGAARRALPAGEQEIKATADQIPEPLTTIYVPNRGKDFAAKTAFLRELSSWTSECQSSGEQVVIGGDLNVALTEADLHPSQMKPGRVGILVRPGKAGPKGVRWRSGVSE